MPDPADRYAGAEVLEARVLDDPKNPAFLTRLRLVRADFKYPLLRVEDRVAVDKATGAGKIVEQKAMVADHIMVKLRKGFTEADLAAVMNPLGATVRRKMPASGVYLIELPRVSVDAVPQALAQFGAPAIATAEPDYIAHAQVAPNDARFGELWGMNNTGQTGGIADADIDAVEAWDVATSRGSLGVLVGVIDTGIDATHPDLAANMWINPNEIASNNLDDDNNGYVDDTKGWDFVNNDSNPHDDNNHGTHCAGTIGGAGNNGAGVAGVCWTVSLVGLKFLDASGSGAISDAVEAVAYATGIGVDLTSNSWGGGGFSQSMADEISEASTAGILFVAAAGNSSSNNDTTPNYPSNYDFPNVIAVAATDHTDGLSSFSSYGLTQVDLGAPGSAILSSVPGGGYSSFSGTSMATPHVAGACALLKSYKPSLSHLTIRELIISSADAIPALAGKCVSGGRLNIHQALVQSNDISVAPGTPFVATGPSGGPYAPASRTYTLTNNAGAPQSWTASKAQPWLDLSASGGTLDPGASAAVTVTLNAATAALPDGTYQDTVVVTNTTSGRTFARSVTLLAGQPDYFTELFDASAHDVDNLRFIFVPDTSTSGYSVSRSSVSGFATDPAGGTSLSLTDDSSVQVTLGGAQQVTLYGTAYSSFHVGSNGYITFGSGDSGYTESLANHFSKPRVAALFDDLLPSAASAISWRQHADRVAVTWQAISEYGATNSNSFQIELFFDGRIAITSLAVAAADGLIGLSRGQGTPANFLESDFSAYPVAQQFTIELPVAATEGAGTLAGQGTVSVVPSPSADLVVTLASGSATELALPATVVIPGGGSSATFDVTIVDDAVVDGTQPAAATASAPGYITGSTAMLVHDNETATLGVVLPATAVEGGLPVVGTVTVTPAPARDVAVTLSSSDITAAKVPLSVTIPAGQSSVPFNLTPEDDTRIDGPQPAQINAQVTGWTAGSASIVVEDDEVKELALILPATALEGAAGVIAQITIPGSLSVNLTISLESSDTSEITVPSSVQIVAGQTSADIPITVVDDTLEDGPQAVTISATATGFSGDSASVGVEDNDPHHFTFAAISNPQVRGAPFSITVTARKADNSVMTGFSGPATLSGAGAGGPVTLTPVLLSGFVAGVWTGSVTGTSVDANVTLTVADSVGRTGASNAFDVLAVGPLHHFTWSTIPSPQVPGTSFSVTLAAKDVVDNTVTAFDGTASISGALPVTQTIGTGTATTTSHPLHTYFHDQRTQIIYTAAEVGGARSLTSLALDVATIPGQSMNNFTIRMRHTTKPDFAASNGVWESAGDLVTVYQGMENVSSTGWRTFTFATPFPYDGASNLLVDISFNNTSYTTAGAVRYTVAPGQRVMHEYSDSGLGDPLTWSGATPSPSRSTSVPNIRIGSLAPLAVSPPVSGTFSAGTWAGSVTVAQEVEGLRLVASDGAGHSGTSNAFDLRHLPASQVSPASLNFVMPAGGSHSKPVTISNTGLGVLNWTIQEAAGGASASIESGPVFASTGPPITGKAHDSPAKGAAHEFSPARARSGMPSGPRAADAGLADVLADLTAGYSSITSLIPNRFDFTNGDTGNSIVDGGSDMYDTGNFLNTNLGSGLAYSNGVIVSSAAFGAGGQYFTRKHPGLFVLAADVSGLSHFEITGNLGADGNGLTDTAVISQSRGGVLFKGFIKRVYNTSDPSVNHLIIVADNGSVNHTASTDTNNDLHRVTSLAGVTRLYYLLFARGDGGYVDDTAMSGIMSAFLDIVGLSQFEFSPAAGSVTPGGTQTMDVTANALNLPLGIHSRFLTLSSGHPAVPPLSIPVTLQIVAAGDADGDSLPDWWETRHGWAPGDGNPVHGQAGDHDGDGTSNFLEFLLDLNPALADRGGLPACSTAVNPSDGLTYLTFTYRRRVGLAGASYVVQVTDSLGSWTSGPAETEELSATQNAGGESETVLVRVKPALTAPGNNRKFVRVSIAIP